MKHEIVEKNIGLMVAFILVAISFGGLVEIVPLFYQTETNQPAPGVKPLSALALEGRDVYIREGCHVCHTQMIRPLPFETKRYGKFSSAGESVYEHPFLWGSKRTGPDLARVGQRYSDEWHYAHLMDPRAVVPESIMPAYPWLDDWLVNHQETPNKLRALSKVGVPYSDTEIESASEAVRGATQMQALIAYLQQLGQHGYK